jgi:hypothetical protein
MPLTHGDIIHMSVPGISHDKFFVLVCLTRSDDAGVVFINSNINPNLFPAFELRELHQKISRSDYPFLTYDSFIDCSDIFKMNSQKIETHLTQYPLDYKGKLNHTDIKKIIELLSRSPKISPRNRLRWGI